MSALEATGMGEWQAVGQVAAAFGPDACRDRWDAFVAQEIRGYRMVAALDAIAETTPEVANAWLNETLVTGRMPDWERVGRQGWGVHLEDLLLPLQLISKLAALRAIFIRLRDPQTRNKIGTMKYAFMTYLDMIDVDRMLCFGHRHFNHP